MGVEKTIGYVLALIGLAIIGLSNIIKTKISFLANSPKGMLYTIMAGIILVILGIAFTLTKSSNKISQAAEEVPIYQGEGKERKIVGYRKATN